MKAFISSTYQDLIDYRKKTAEALERLGQQGIRMEVFGARPEGAIKVCRDEIDDADVFIGIYAHRYGHSPSGSDLSITEMEYIFAVEQQKPIFCFLVDEDYPWRPAFIEEEPNRSKLRAFKGRINSNLVRDTFTTPDDLAFKVAASVGHYLFTKAVKEELDRAAEKQPVGTEQSRDQVARRAARLSSIISGSKILLVNDIPSEMYYVIKLYESLGITVTVATTSTEALSLLAANSYDLVVSDMRRGSVVDEGIRFLNDMRTKGLYRPTILTPGYFEPERGTPPYAFGITNRVDELLNLTFDVLERLHG
jgi:CheY-like chemotaxis protein